MCRRYCLVKANIRNPLRYLPMNRTAASLLIAPRNGSRGWLDSVKIARSPQSPLQPGSSDQASHGVGLRCALQPKSGSSGLLGTALIDPEETFKNTLLALLRNTNAGILDGQQHMIPVHPHAHMDTSTRPVVADRIVAQVVQQLLEHILISIYGTGASLT